MAEIELLALYDLERHYRSTRDRYAISSHHYHFNDGRLHAIADLRRDLQEQGKESFQLHHVRERGAA